MENRKFKSKLGNAAYSVASAAFRLLPHKTARPEQDIKAGIDEKRAEDKKEYAGAQDQPPAPQPEIQPIQPLVDAPHADASERDTQQERHPPHQGTRRQWRRNLPVVMSILNFLVTLSLATFAYFQWQESKGQREAARDQANISREQTGTMKGQLESMESSSNQTQDLIAATLSIAERNKELVEQAGKQANASMTQAIASAIQAEAAKQSVTAMLSQSELMNKQLEAMLKQSELMDKSIEEARETRIIENSPYITIQTGELDKPITSAGYYTLLVPVKNVGKYPANQVLTAVRWTTELPPFLTRVEMNKMSFDLTAARQYKGGSQETIPPGGDFTIRIPITLDKMGYSFIFLRQRRLYMLGALEYFDPITSKINKMYFCRKYLSQTRVAICPDVDPD